MIGSPSSAPANIAAQTRLPQSPDHGIDWLLDPPPRPHAADNNNHPAPASSRLRSIARYETFHPQALACSPPILLNQQQADDGDDGDGSSGSCGGSSLGAVAGTDGVALFRISQPHRPLLMLSHDAGGGGVVQQQQQHQQSSSSVTSLRFQPAVSTQSLWLASARGSGVLVWDVSGHSLSPLQGRLGVDTNETITSLAWKQAAANADESWLAATTATSAFLWDLRSSALRPSLRFGVVHTNSSSGGGGISNNTTTKASAAAPPRYLQIACTPQHECAILDAAGTVRVFDTRLTDRSTRRSSSTGTGVGNGSLCQFQACEHAGVGLTYLPLATEPEHCWVTWGLDEPNADAIVKVWKSGGAGSGEETARSAAKGEDDYWYMDTSPTHSKQSRKQSQPSTSAQNESSGSGYRLVGQCTTRGLACARVCPSPVEDSIVTVGLHNNSTDGGGGWRADLWKLKKATTEDSSSSSSSELSLERIVSFEGSDRKMESKLKAVMGDDARFLRSLRASELAVSASFAGPHPTKSFKEEEESPSSPSDFGLLLCCLTEKGYVTTHAIPEALPEAPGASGSHALRSSGPQDGKLLATTVAPPKKRFPAEWEGAVTDAANAWAKPGDSFMTGGSITEKGSAVDLGETPTGSIGGSMHGATGGSVSGIPVMAAVANSDGGLMLPFDMDVPVAYSMASAGIAAGIPTATVNDLVSPGAVSAVGAAEDKNKIDRDAIDAAAIMDSIETDRIPCPRLCGATFSFGVGGLAAFNNGNVQKMWHWWERSDPTRFAAVPGLIGEPSLKDPKKIIAGSAYEVSGLSNLPSTNCPRTLKDLVNMTRAAKEAQWGEHDESDASSTGFPALGSNFFEDDSDASSDSVDERSGDVAEVSESKRKQTDLYGNYFDAHQRPVAQSSDISLETSEPTSKGDDTVEGVFTPAVGPASDMLTPMVKVSHEYDRLALNNQNPDLATGWKLGDLTVGPHYGSQVFTEEALSSLEAKAKRVLPSYQSLQETRIMSTEEERGVHGGEYSVRPNMQESMVFLRKLFSHQKQESGNASFSNLMSPPDSPLLPNSLKKVGGGGAGGPKLPLDFDAPRGRKPRKISEIEGKELMNIENLCLHNAEVCKLLGEHQKKETWNIIAKIVRSRIQNLGQGLDGWGGLGGGALGVGLVTNLLRYYEALGDVQMLSTIVCVLRDRCQTLQYGKRRGWFLLPPNQEAKYDNYIRRYAELMYGWGLLTMRAELNKHLIRSIPQIESGGAEASDVSDENQSSAGIAFVIQCPRCGSNSEFGTNFCRSCQDYAFRCALCDQAVRGLFTVCDCCGHGGHVNHMKEWFTSHDACPSGCGCNCRLASSVMQRESDFLALSTASNVMQPVQLTQQLDSF